MDEINKYSKEICIRFAKFLRAISPHPTTTSYNHHLLSILLEKRVGNQTNF